VKLGHIAAIVLAAATMFIFVAYKNYFGLYLNLEVKPADVLILAVSVIGVAILQSYLAGVVADARIEKDLLIENIRGARDALRSCREQLDVCYQTGKIGQANGKKVLLLFRRLSNSVEQLETAFGKSRCGDLLQEVQGIKFAYLNLKIAATGGNFWTKPYDPQAVSSQEQLCRRLNAQFQELIFLVNKHR
jgi:hypothetical protein